MKFLDKVVLEKGREIERARKKLPLSKFKGKLAKSKANFRRAIGKKNRNGFPCLIAEIKRASPSKGIIAKNFDVKKTAKLYGKYADAVSVLTDEKFFRGKKQYLKIAGKCSKLPVLRKDFIIDSYQVYESRHYGADAVLLIARLLSKEKINEFIKIAKSLGMDCLVEADSKAGLKKVLGTNTEIVGINNRDLGTLKIVPGKAKKLIDSIPGAKRKKIVVIAESSIGNRLDVEKLNGKANAVLVGSSIMASRNPNAKLKELTGNPLVKICGITTKKDALDAAKLGADFLGFNFYGESPRYIAPEKAKKIISKLPGRVYNVGVFVNEKIGKVNSIAKKLGLDIVQLHGDESNAYCGRVKLPVVKAFRVKGKKSLGEINKYKTPLILLDAFVNGLYGGTGKKIDYNLIRGANLGGRLVFISGGINAGNVKNALKLRPFAIDACSGVERARGKKSHRKMDVFIREVCK